MTTAKSWAAESPFWRNVILTMQHLLFLHSKLCPENGTKENIGLNWALKLWTVRDIYSYAPMFFGAQGSGFP
jgi:hypothetical protein